MEELDFLKVNWAEAFFSQYDLPGWAMTSITLGIDILVLILVSLIADFLSRRILLTFVKRIVQRTKATWDDHFYEQKVFKNLAHLVPALIVKIGLPVIFNDYEKIIPYLNKAVSAYIIILFAIILNKVFKSLIRFANSMEKWKNHPVRTILQVFQILNFFLMVVLLISLFFGASVGSILGALAGTTAILILIFQDSINGLLANFQISMYDLLKEGDWITFDKFGVDGDVISIDLTTVKVRNFDNTISSVPAKAFVNDSFVNWRGMKEMNVRRIKRNILIDIDSIRYLEADKLESFSKVQLISDYVVKRQKEIDEFNKNKKKDTSLTINGRQQTNIGVFRQYVLNYLENHPMVANNQTMMARQLQPTPNGVPLEVYCFSKTTVWTEYEKLQSDIFDHLYAAAPYFGLRLFQAPSGRDIRFLHAGERSLPTNGSQKGE
ncbi:MAG: mechanosensitive ion channel family protein [Bacteroidota bacterium]|nr:mechanosensitive ion channel family protein [Bacteroidota bacterium]MDX5447759.1 mechanosensitive ion channel family protein [Bacteroidota bacterium]